MAARKTRGPAGRAVFYQVLSLAKGKDREGQRLTKRGRRDVRRGFRVFLNSFLNLELSSLSPLV